MSDPMEIFDFRNLRWLKKKKEFKMVIRTIMN